MANLQNDTNNTQRHKRRKKAERKVVALVITAFLAVIAIGITLAYFNSQTDALTNTFTLGNVTTEIEENIGTNGEKAPVVKNTGANDCLVRMRVTISPSSAEEKIGFKELDSSNWSESSDGFYYYNKVLKAGLGGEGEGATTPLFTQVLPKDESKWTEELFNKIGPFEITLYHESVQASVYDPVTKTMISAYDEDGNYDSENAAKIWKIYDE